MSVGSSGSASASGAQHTGTSRNPSSQENTSSSQASGGRHGRSERNSQGGRKPVTCYGCGESGHIRPNCPNRVRRVKPQGGSAVIMIDGCLAGFVAKDLRIDTGADRTVVRKDFIPETAYTGNSIHLDSWRGSQPSQHKLARIDIKVGSAEAFCEVAVADKLDCPALLGADLGGEITVKLMKHVISQSTQEPLAPVEAVTSQTHPIVIEGSGQNEVLDSAPVRVTRAQEKREQSRVEADELASAQSECRPRDLTEVLDFPESYFEDDPVTTPVAELCTWPVVERVDIPLPTVVSNDSDKGRLVFEQQADKSLEQLLNLAKKGEKGYGLEDKVLVHYFSDSLGDCNQWVVVPSCRRQQILKIAHSNLSAGHFGVKKTFAKISRHFLWPRMWADVKASVWSCAGCQREARNDNSKAPLQPLPCVAEPFEKVAFDLVGPLPRSSSGHRYILTMMCLYTKYPEAIPLRRVDNETV